MNPHKIICLSAIALIVALFGIGGAFVFAKWEHSQSSVPMEVREDVHR